MMLQIAYYCLCLSAVLGATLLLSALPRKRTCALIALLCLASGAVILSRPAPVSTPAPALDLNAIIEQAVSDE